MTRRQSIDWKVGGRGEELAAKWIGSCVHEWKVSGVLGQAICVYVLT